MKDNELMVFCEHGHAYDSSEYERCPFCYGEEANKQVGYTRGADLYDDDDVTPTVAGNSKNMAKQSSSRETGAFYDFDSDESTKSAYMKEKGMDPVVGWLVAVSGELQGNDYRIHADNNYIGRSRKMHICIMGDETISKENHACISYDSRNKKFYFTPGMGRNIVRVNENAIFSTTELKSYDILELGVTKFVFVPFCGKDFDWDKVISKGEE